MERTRDRDRAALPEPMRRDVRLLGDILGEIIRDSGGPGLLADVERLRHAVIDARHDDHDAGDEIATLVASWSLEQAEQVARAFAVYFHLANLAEEHQRIRNLRERDTGTEPVRESLAAAVAEIGRGAGPEHLRELLASLRVHLVLTAHPTAARGGGRATPDQRAARRAGRPARSGGRPRRGAPRAARADRPAVADVTAAGQGDGPHRRGPHGDDRVRRDAVPGGPRRIPGAGSRRSRVCRSGVAAAALPALRQLVACPPGRQPARDRRGQTV